MARRSRCSRPGIPVIPAGLRPSTPIVLLSALRRLEQLTAEAGFAQPMREVIGEAVDVVISIERTPTGRRVREVISVGGFAGGQYQIETFEHQGHRNAA